MSSRLRDAVFYVSVSAGMALATCTFMMVSGMFELASSAWVLMSIALGGGLCVLVSLAVAELASMFPSSPGIRTYLKAALGNRASLITVYMYLSFIVLMAGVESYAFALVANNILGAASPTLIVTVLLVWVLLTNLAGLELPRSMQMLTTFGCIAAVTAAGIWGVAATDGALSRIMDAELGDASLWVVLPGQVGISIFLFMGFEWVTPLGLKPDAYKRQIPMAMPIAIAILAVAYLAFSAGLISRLDRPEIVASPIPHVSLLEDLLGTAGAWVALIISMLATFSTFNAGLMGGSRILRALAQEGAIPRWIGWASPTTGTPAVAVSVLSLLTYVSSLAIIEFHLELVAGLVGASVICYVYAAFLVSAVRMRKLHPARSRPFRAPLPSAVMAILGAILLVVAVQSLISLPAEPYLPAIITAVVVVVAVAGGVWSIRRMPDSARPAPAIRRDDDSVAD